MTPYGKFCNANRSKTAITWKCGLIIPVCIKNQNAQALTDLQDSITENIKLIYTWLCCTFCLILLSFYLISDLIIS